MAYTPSMNRLIQEFSKLPGIGEKTAARLAFHVLRCDRRLADGLADALKALKEQTRLCQTCTASPGPTSARSAPTASATDVICVVEEPADLIAIERSRGFRGRYHACRALSPLDGSAPRSADRRPLAASAGGHGPRDHRRDHPTVEGGRPPYPPTPDQPLGVRVTRIAHGIPMGATSNMPTS
jgi:recombination protein RecR